MTKLETLGAAAKKASVALAITDTEAKNRALMAIADALAARADEWIKANEADVDNARRLGMRPSLIDRLLIDKKRVSAVADGVREVARLNDPIGEEIDNYTRPNGLIISKKRVPLGVIAIIYEARPNVTVDAAALCLKSGNACILRGGKEAVNSNLASVKIMREALKSAGLSADAICFVEDTSRESASELMHLNDYVDVLIPRGGAGLIRAVTKEASVPVIKTGEGVCHVYIDKSADLRMGANVLYNAKCSRPSVCNAVECVIVHRDVLGAFWEEALLLLKQKDVQIRADSETLKALGYAAVPADESDWDAEYGDYTLAAKSVNDISEAIDFINAHGTRHSECIITTDDGAAERFFREVDAAAVYLNASTRFTDGGEFGLGAEIGISTQKLHARGPMGLNELTSYKYIIRGAGQIR